MTWVPFLVASKQLKEAFADRRTLIGAFLMPVLLLIGFNLLFGSLENRLAARTKLELTVVGSEQNPVIQQLLKQPDARIERAADLQEARRRLKDGQTLLVMEFPEADASGMVRARVLFDGQRTTSALALAGLRQAVARANLQTRDLLLQQAGTQPDQIPSIEVSDEDVSKASGVGASPLLLLIPYLVVLWAFYGGLSQAADHVAGEKERRTLETLLLAPVSRSSLVWGKLMSLGTICLLSGVMSIVGLALSNLFSGDGFLARFSPASIVSFLIVLTSLVLMYSGMMLAVSSMARSMRQAQTYLSLISFLVMMPAAMSQFIGIMGEESSAWVRWTPVLNAAVSLGQAMKDRPDFGLDLQVILVGAAIGAACIAWTMWKWNDESILARD